MSNLGISIVGSVAQSTLQAQQVSRANHRQQTDTAAEARKVRELLEAHFAALDEGDEATLLSQLHVDEQVPEREHSPDEFEAEKKPAGEDQPAEASAEITPDDEAEPVHRHLDVTA